MASAWYSLCERCELLYAKYEKKYPIPSLVGFDPEQVFLETHVEEDVWRFVVFILWLKRQPMPIAWYSIIRREHPELIRQALRRLSTL